MAWIESHTILIRHRKLIDLSHDLRLRPVYVMGHLHALWHAALEQAEDGDLSQWSDDFIASSACYPGSAPQFVSLLQKHHWLDGKIIHDWLDYSGKYLEAKYRSSKPERLIAIWAKHGIEYTKAFGKQVKPGWIALRKEILERDNYICHYCGKTSDHMEVDHIIPVNEGGTDDPVNLVACCRSCNRKKSDKPYESQTKASPPNHTYLTNQTKNKSSTAEEPAVTVKNPVDNPEVKQAMDEVYRSGFNIYALVGKVKKRLRWNPERKFPDKVILRVCAEYKTSKPEIKDHWPWLVKVLKAESEAYYAEEAQKEHKQLSGRGGGLSLADILSISQKGGVYAGGD